MMHYIERFTFCVSGLLTLFGKNGAAIRYTVTTASLWSSGATATLRIHFLSYVTSCTSILQYPVTLNRAVRSFKYSLRWWLNVHCDNPGTKTKTRKKIINLTPKSYCLWSKVAIARSAKKPVKMYRRYHHRSFEPKVSALPRTAIVKVAPLQ